MKLATDWISAARAAFERSERVLCVAVRAFGHPDCVAVKELAEVLGSAACFDGIVWRASSPLRPGLEQVRRLLRPEGVLLCVAEPLGLSRRLWSTLSLGTLGAPVLLEDACEGLLLTGFAEPTLVAKAGAGFALRARKPRAFGALDAFFEQPSE